MFRSMLLAALMLPAIAFAEDQVRKLDTFYGINVKGPVNIFVEVGKPQGVTISGDAEFIRCVNTVVDGGVLRLVYESEKEKGVTIKDSQKITITVPALTSFRVLGAGVARVNNIAGERIDMSFEGAGALFASGKVKLLRLKGQGVGEVNTKDLVTERADVNFNGMGDVHVHATDTLNLVVQGMGNFKYYGNPKHVNKSVSGLGSVSAGK
ncbi:GIN domain-containing protein [Pseudoduganella sp. OTU4001]|uniref:GIN domain-containing protein n=1 Tax=Pseudoduganella sp. OTU4001 TaxID=3043854 RepID=UPI00313BDBAD